MRTTAPLCLIALVDALGTGLLLPVVPKMLGRFEPDPARLSLQIGAFVALYALAQLVASPWLGALSDRVGRRPVLLASLLIGTLDYVVMALAPTLGVLFASRAVAGLTGANLTVVGAVVADQPDVELRAARYGWTGASFGAGLTLGPALGGWLAPLGVERVCLVAAGLHLVGLVVTGWGLPESRPRAEEVKAPPPTVQTRSLERLLPPRPLRWLLLAFFLNHLPIQTFGSVWAMHGELRYGWSATEIGASLTLAGLGFVVAQGLLAPAWIRRLGPHATLALGLGITAAGHLGVLVASTGSAMFLLLVLTLPVGVTHPVLRSMAAALYPPERQGQLNGILGSLASLAAIVGSAVFTLAFAVAVRAGGPPWTLAAPFALSALCATAAGVCLWAYLAKETTVRP